MPRKPKAEQKPKTEQRLVADMTQQQLEEVVGQQLMQVLKRELHPEYTHNGKIKTEESKTFSEFLIETGLTTRKHRPHLISLRAPLVKYHKADGEKPPMELYLPFMTAAMQSVTGETMMIRAAQMGFLGTCYCSQSIKDEADMVRNVKKAKAGFVVPDCFSPGQTLEEVIVHMKKTGKSTFPVTEDGKSNGKIVGLITRYGIYEPHDKGKHYKVRDRMWKVGDFDPFAMVEADDLGALNRKMYMKGKKFLMVCNPDGTLKHMVFRKDMEQHFENPHAITDEDKRYLTAAAINTHDYKRRAKALVDAGVDILVIDASDGYTEWQRDALRFVNNEFEGKIPVIGGNVINREGFLYLVKNGASAVKVGMGGGSICITREQKGTGKGQANAVLEVCEERDRYFKKEGIYVPVISDGGIVVSKDMAVALICGADAVMMGRYFARFTESPTDIDENTGMKPYWGEGSKRAWAWMRKRYGQKAFEEGVEGFVPHLGPMGKTVDDTVFKIKQTMLSAGCRTIDDLHRTAVLIPMSAMTMREGKPHDILYTDPLGTYKEKNWG